MPIIKTLKDEEDEEEDLCYDDEDEAEDLICRNCGGNQFWLRFEEIEFDVEVLDLDEMQIDWTSMMPRKSGAILRCKGFGCGEEKVVTIDWDEIKT